MSISFTLINKTSKTRNVGEVVEAFTDAVDANYTQSEKEGYVTSQGKSCLSVLFRSDELASVSQQDSRVQNIKVQDSNLVLVKKVLGSEGVKDLVSMIGGATSPFVVLELTSLISGLDKRPPWTVADNQLVFPVGMLGPYFKSMPNSPYKDNSKGLDFAKDYPDTDVSTIATAYFDKFTREGKLQDMTNPDVSSLMHFTTVVTPKENSLQFSFLQNQMMAVRYFFEPDIAFTNNEFVMRSMRHSLYPEQDIPLKGRLGFYQTTIPLS
ncbi:hypothetical protein A2368_01365 [Candidatus Collierbacteria bacterium RIFOXYB1_FULL_49_13]|uniref:Uncharacterized protein n=1 Tax=Candidatus Collierbacteria bacterium RIFOXYB1_FULL_49_13 TaxID=1817728 RepID=A0A1F5FGP6_9BACT|nr:MAG: hypothetical protein A2368_01365 [Candidatus Collierbacteria bacterium RIFOXYB1_FULL_49_13]